MRVYHRSLCATLFLSLIGLASVPNLAGSEGSAGVKPSVVKVAAANGAFHLTRNGALFFIKGAGGDGSKTLLRACGGNSFRTWGVDNLGSILDEAQKQGVMVTAGIWLGHKEHGFDYNNQAQVAAQFEMARNAVLKYKDHPALLLWGIGNEMEGYDGSDKTPIWNAVNSIAAMIKRVDPNHPTMTVIAEIGGNKVESINRLCPNVDIIGINSYGGAASIPARYVKAGGSKPYIMTEYGPPGVWEIGKNAFGASLEPTSTAKADIYRKIHQQAIQNQKLCLGGYAFTWGNKQEATATWFGLLLPDGSRLGGVDALQECWTGTPPAHPCPALRSLKIMGADQVTPGATVKAALDVTASESDALRVKWVLQRDDAKPNLNGDAENAPPAFPDAITSGDSKQATVRMPSANGVYRLFAYVHDAHGGAATANVPVFVTGSAAASSLITVAKTAKEKPSPLPLVIYDEAGRSSLPFAPSGYMGNVGAITLDPNCDQNPHSGKTCLRVRYGAKDNWGGVIWQSPANDWGDLPGGKNLTGAAKLTFWARGERGGETVGFLCGIIEREKPFFDTVHAKLDRVALSKEWQQYSIDLKGKDLTRVKSGFGWTLAATGEPVTFYLDDVRFE